MLFQFLGGQLAEALPPLGIAPNLGKTVSSSSPTSFSAIEISSVCQLFSPKQITLLLSQV